ncbi:MAG TPA: PocR ligand-binding domain-containing protein [Thermoclostridium sp.]|nr:PocR ligand-binding domain-containing protein [Thermoclostridium sp.]
MRDELGFDCNKAIKAVQHYSNVTNLPAFLIDDTGSVLYSTYSENKFCKFCSDLMHPEETQPTREYIQNSNSNISCRKVHLYGSYQAERFGGKYVYFCPLGLAHWASPITVEGMMKGAILSGPVHMLEPEESLIAELFAKYLDDEQLLNAINYSKSIPVINTELVNSMSEILAMIAFYLSDSTRYQYAIDRKEQKQAASISEHIHKLKKTKNGGSDISSYPIEKERELLSAISICNKPLAQKLLNEILGHIFFASGNDFELIRARVLELIVLLSRAALEGGAEIEQIFGMNYQYLNQINHFQSLEELTPWLSRIMERFTDYVFNMTNVKHKDVMFKSIDYINKNYMKKIALDHVAANVYLSPSYFSKIFNEEMKMNFNSYLNYVRIEMSKKLLLDQSISLVDVSNLVGFEDQSYFSKVFKKLTGQTPNKYRKSRGRDEVV